MYPQFPLSSYKILNNGQVTWTSSEVLDWFRIPEGRFCLDREVGGESTGVDGGSSVVTEVLVGCLEDFIPRINDVRFLNVNYHLQF